MPSQTTDIAGRRPINEWLDGLGTPGSAIRRQFNAIYGTPELAQGPIRRCLEAVAAFAAAFGAERSVLIVRSAGRINLLGMHVDHRGGSVNPIAIRESFLIVEPREDDQVIMRDINNERFPEERFRIAECLPQGRKIDDWDAWCHDEFEARKDDPTITWSNYFRAGILFFQHHYTGPDGQFDPAFKGMNVLLSGNVPPAAGLSTSSCLVIGSAEAILRINGCTMDPMEFVQLCGTAEWYVGTRGGFGDHAAIKFGQPRFITHMTAFPFTVSRVPFPSDYRVVMADSSVEAKKQAGGRDAFNNRVASYNCGLLIARRFHPEHAERMEHLRDLRPERLQCSEAEIYRILKSLPEQVCRRRIRELLPEHASELERIFRSHAEPETGYRIRQICLYGIAECIRADMAVPLLESGDIDGFGKLITLHHDGDRITRRRGGRQEIIDKTCPDAWIEERIADCESDDSVRVERSRLWRQPGGYDVSVPEVDWLVDLALETPGVIGAGLVGAGLGGSMIAVVKADQADALVRRLEHGYYQPLGLEPRAAIVFPVKGAGILD